MVGELASPRVRSGAAGQEPALRLVASGHAWRYHRRVNYEPPQDRRLEQLEQRLTRLEESAQAAEEQRRRRGRRMGVWLVVVFVVYAIYVRYMTSLL